MTLNNYYGAAGCAPHLTTNAAEREDYLPLPTIDWNEGRQPTANSAANDDDDILPLPTMDMLD